MSSRVTVPRDLSSGLDGRYALERELGRGGSAIVPLFDSGGTHGFLYYVMPFVPGGTVTVRQSESDIWVMELKR